MRTIRALGAIGVLTVTLVPAAPVAASDADASRVLGFEAVADWTISNGTISGTSATRTQGQASLAVLTQGYTTLTSRLIGPLGNVAKHVSFDVELPTSQPNPSWFGAAQLFVSAPSLGINNAYLGQQELTGLPLGSFATLGFDLPDDIHAKLQGTYFDLTFTVVLNVPTNSTGTYLIDNLQVSSTIPPNSTIGSPDLPRILGFENTDDWSATGGTITGASFGLDTQGNFSLAFQPTGYSTLASVPMTAIGPVNPEITLDVRLPAQEPNPYWFGAVQLYVTLPSQGLNSAFVGQQELTGLSTQAFHTLHFPLPSDLRAKLNATSYSDLRLTIALNAPTPNPGVYNFDNIQVGAVTNPSTDAFTDLRTDLVGRAHSGAASLHFDEHDGSPPVQDAIFYVRSDDGLCVPSDTTVCRFLVSTIRIQTGPFSLDGHDFGAGVIRNSRPFRITLGGTNGLSARIPTSVLFSAQLTSKEVLVAAPSAINFTVNPGGGGLISMSGSMSGKIDDKGFILSLSITADSPLVNRMPVADAGPAQTLTSTSGCVVTGNLDGSATTDPDGNLQSITWLQNGTTFVGMGTVVPIKLKTRGQTSFTALAVDAFGAQGTAETTVNVELPASCP